jgi:hypothetical protein
MLPHVALAENFFFAKKREIILSGFAKLQNCSSAIYHESSFASFFAALPIFFLISVQFREKIESWYSQKHCAVNRINGVPYYESGRDVFSLLCAVNVPLLGAHQTSINTSSLLFFFLFFFFFLLLLRHQPIHLLNIIIELINYI